MANERKSILCDSILIEGSTILGQKSEAVKDVKNLGDKELAILSQLYVEMHKRDKMQSLSAVQLGLLSRICAIRNEKGTIIFMINPEIILKLGIRRVVEDCYSVNGKYKVFRPFIGCVRFYDVAGEKHVLFFKKDIIKLIAHEIDHMDGILITKGKRYDK